MLQWGWGEGRALEIVNVLSDIHVTAQIELRLLWRSSLPVLACTGILGMLVMIPKGNASKTMSQILDCHSSWKIMQCLLSRKNSRES